MKITFETLKFENEEKRENAKKWKNFFNENIIQATFGIMENNLYYGLTFAHFKEHNKNIIDILGIENCYNIYEQVIENMEGF